MNWEKQIRGYLKVKFTGILARGKWDDDDIEDVMGYFFTKLAQQQGKIIKQAINRNEIREV